MNYGNPNYFSIIFSATAAVIIFYLWTLRRRRKILERFADKNLLGEIAPLVSIRRKIIKMAILALALFLCGIAIVRPRWGFEWQEAKRTGLDILIAIDVSKSMLATDVKPNRLERSKFAVKDLVKRLNGDRIGLIAFAGTAFLQCPLTIDYNGFLLSLDDLNVGTIPRGGTSMSSAIKEALDIFKGQEKKYKVLIIISDGEDFEGNAVMMARDASALGVKIYCIGVGSPEGELINVSNQYGQRGYLTDKSGAVVNTKLNEEILKAIAIATGGNYIRATQKEFGLVLLYDKGISKLEKRDIETKMRKHYEERYQYFLALALLLLLIEPFISERKRAAR